MITGRNSYLWSACCAKMRKPVYCRWYRYAEFVGKMAKGVWHFVCIINADDDRFLSAKQEFNVFIDKCPTDMYNDIMGCRRKTI